MARDQHAPLPHRAARIEDAIHSFRAKWARKRGLVPTVVPYSGYGSAGWVRVLGRVLLVRPLSEKALQRDRAKARIPGKDRPRYRSVRGWRSFTSVPAGAVTVSVTAGGRVFTVAADRGGVIDTTIEVDLPFGMNTIEFRADDAGTAVPTDTGSTATDSHAVGAPVYIVDPAQRFGIVSDIDDTVMVTALPRPFLAAWNTFVLDEHARRPVAGMSVLYERLVRSHPGGPVLYLSTGAWNVAPTLRRFLTRNMYPSGALLLTDWGPTHDRLFRSGRLHKQENLRRLAREFPELKWLLIGDDGQHDEALYAEFAREHPDSVAAVCIRQLSPSEAVFAGGRSSLGDDATPSGIPWLYASDGAGLAELLTGIGILPPQ